MFFYLFFGSQIPWRVEMVGLLLCWLRGADGADLPRGDFRSLKEPSQEPQVCSEKCGLAAVLAPADGVACTDPEHQICTFFARAASWLVCPPA